MTFICIVCRELLTNRPEGHGPGIVDIISTKCGHMYHRHCLMEWFRRKVNTANPRTSLHQCPYCNAVITPATDVLRIFPSENEETEELAAKSSGAKPSCSSVEKGNCQLKERKPEFKGKQRPNKNLKTVGGTTMSMTQWQRDHIRRNLVELINDTRCNSTVLAHLRSKNILSYEDESELLRSGLSTYKQAMEMYEILVGRHNAYEVLMEALLISKQTRAYNILRQGLLENGEGDVDEQRGPTREERMNAFKNGANTAFQVCISAIGQVAHDVYGCNHKWDEGGLKKALEDYLQAQCDKLMKEHESEQKVDASSVD